MSALTTLALIRLVFAMLARGTLAALALHVSHGSVRSALLSTPNRQALLESEDVKNYDGSWTEWGNLVNVPIENGA